MMGNHRSRHFPFPRLDPAIRNALAVFLFLRIMTLVWMWGVRQVFSQPVEPDPVQRPYLGVAIESNPWLEPWQRWDTLHYQAIAERGYRAFDSALFVPPLYPFLMRSAGRLLGGSTLLAGILIANLAYLWALVVFYRLAQNEMNDPQAASRATLYLAAFPTAFFFLAAYTESLFLLAALLAIMYTNQRKWWQAGIWGAVAALTRLPGLLIVVPLTYAALKSSASKISWKPWLSPFLTLVGGSIYPLYVGIDLHLPPWMPWTVQNARGQAQVSFPGMNIVSSISLILSRKATGTDWIDLIFLLIFILLLIPVWRGLPRIYSVYYLTFLGLYLTRMSQIQPLLSMSRYVLVFFPAFMVMGKLGRRPWLHRLILYGSWLGLLYLSGQFAIWGWVG